MSSLQPISSPRQTPTWLPIVIAAVLALALGLGLGWWLGGRDSGVQGGASTPTASPCPTPAPLPAATTVTVNVFNATDKAGLAKKAATDLESRSFGIGDVGNDESKRTVTGVAEVRHGPAGERAAALVAANIAGAVTLVPDQRTDATVDLAIGPAYAGLAAPAEVTAKTTAATAAPATC